MPRAAPESKTPRFVLLAAVCVIIAALYFAQDVLIPLALATLLTFLLTPIVQRLERWRLHRVTAVIVTVIIAFGTLGVLTWIVVDQGMTLASQLPTYKENIKAKLHWLPLPGKGGVIGQIKQTVNEVQQEIDKSTAATKPTVAEPMTVRVAPPEPTPWELLRTNAGMVAGPLGTAGIVAIFVIFMLLQREDLRNRIIRLVGYGRLTLTTQAIDDAATRISRYLVAQAIVNGTYGVAISIGLWIIGRTIGHSDPPFPNCLLWGLICGLIRFIPYVGPWIGAAFPLFLSLAVYKSVGVFIAVGVMFVTIELLSNNVMEPLLYGSSTGLSTLAILVAAVFWTWLWGPVGLILATPLTVCVVVLGKYVPQLHFLDILLGDEPVLAPHERLYQRWLALDQEEAAELAHEFFQERSLEQMYDQILLPAMAMAEEDRHTGQLDDRRQTLIRQSVRGLIDELGDEFRMRLAKTSAGTSTIPGKENEKPENGNGRMTVPKDRSVNIVILPAHDEADEIVGLMLAQLLEFNNFSVTNVSQNALAGEMLDVVESKQAHAVCISALPPAAVTHARYLCKRLRPRYREMPLVIGLWTATGDLKRAQNRIACEGQCQLVVKLAEALNQIEQLTHPVVVQQQGEPVGAK
jgi:predicted PurR-regulated permease PerM